MALGGLGDFVDGLEPGIGIIDGGEEREVSFVGGVQELSQSVEAIDGFLQRRELEALGAVAVFHPAVVFEEGDVVSGAFNAQNEPGFIVELERGGSHGVANACSLDTGLEIVAELIGVGAGELSSEEGGDVFGFHRVDGAAHEGLIEGLKLGLAMKEDIGGELHLHEAPVVLTPKLRGHGAIGFDTPVENTSNFSGNFRT